MAHRRSAPRQRPAPEARARARLAPLLLAAALAPATTVAQAPAEPAAPAPDQDQALAQEAPAEDPGWLERSHQGTTEAMLSILERVDAFFGNDRESDITNPRTRVRLKNQLTLEQGGGLRYGLGASASFKLPGLDRRLENARLALTGFSGDGGAAAAQEGSAEGTEPGATGPQQRAGSAELRVDLFRRMLASADLGGGVKLQRPVVPYGRARLHGRAVPVEGLVLRATEAVSYEINGDRLGSTTTLQADAYGGESVRAGVSLDLQISERSRGFEWAGEAGVGWIFIPRGAAVYAAVGGLALTEPYQAFDHVRVFGGLRANLFRGWIYGQLEPELRWADGTTGPLHRVWAVTATLELVYDTLDLAARR